MLNRNPKKVLAKRLQTKEERVRQSNMAGSTLAQGPFDSAGWMARKERIHRKIVQQQEAARVRRAAKEIKRQANLV